MSTEIQSVEDFRVKYSRGSQEDGGVREQSEVEVLDDGEQHPDVGLQEADVHTEKKLPAVRRSWFRAFEVNLGVLYLLIVVGIMTRYALNKSEFNKLHFKHNKLNHSYNELQTEHQETKRLNSQLQEEVKKLKEKIEEKCPEGWTRFGSSCYFKPTESKTWSDSRRACQDIGADLVMINSKEEQEFVSNFRGESWIGLRANQTSGGYKWEWVDGSALTERFLAERHGNPSYGYYGACCDDDGRWRGLYYSYSMTFICEK
ncbi:CD209 antigen-like protein E isoform X2 [Astatotilapia calliptera]|uniref:CD209 antigen-like protein E isoform X2 n=1 Tax=Astatotilapia calliptera TaxID=8154 RepID=UPI000E3FDD89|nr:CD209 antigen-like protein E isoform X2 [Astatotilapia calliptera]